MNVIARLEYYDSAVHRFNHYTTRTSPIFIFFFLSGEVFLVWRLKYWISATKWISSNSSCAITFNFGPIPLRKVLDPWYSSSELSSTTVVLLLWWLWLKYIMKVEFPSNKEFFSFFPFTPPSFSAIELYNQWHTFPLHN